MSTMRARLDQRNHRLGNLGRHVIANAVGAELLFQVALFFPFHRLAYFSKNLAPGDVAMGVATGTDLNRIRSLARLVVG